MQLFGTNSGLSTSLLLAFALFALSTSAMPQPQDDSVADNGGEDVGGEDVSNSAKGKGWEFTSWAERRETPGKSDAVCKKRNEKSKGNKPKPCTPIGKGDARANGISFDNGNGRFQLCLYGKKDCSDFISVGDKKNRKCGEKSGGFSGVAYKVVEKGGCGTKQNP